MGLDRFHRIVHVNPDGSYVTKGNANNAADDEPVRRSPTRAAMAIGLIAGLVVVAPTASPAAATAPVEIPNPPLAKTCGLEVTFVLDASGSLDSAATESVRNAADLMLHALVDTSSTARITQFGTVAAELAPSTVVDEAALGPGGNLAEGLVGYRNPVPPRPPDVDFYRYDGTSNPNAAHAFTKSNSGNIQYSNWHQALAQTATAPSDLIVFLTDGQPTAYDLTRNSDPFSRGPPPDVAFDTNRGKAQDTTLERPVEESDSRQSAGTRILAVGVGQALIDDDPAARLVAISGPQIVRDAGLDDVDTIDAVDVALVTDFDRLAEVLHRSALERCGPTVTVRKLAQTAEEDDYLPSSGWPITVTPSTGGDPFEWILPDAAPAPSKTVPTGDDGSALFQWNVAGATPVSGAVISEPVPARHTPGRPGPATDYRCELQAGDGQLRVVEGQMVQSGGLATFALPDIGRDAVTCTVWNSYDYQPAVALTKVNTPSEVRGDLDPPAVVTSRYTVTDPGTTPLVGVDLADDACGPVEAVPPSGPNAGDDDGDGRLDPGEAWQYQCDRATRASLRVPDPVVMVNRATAVALAVGGATVTATATDDVDVFVPAITVSVLVNGQPEITVVSGTPVSYTYQVTNDGNTPLGAVVLADDRPPCEAPARGPDSAGGNNDGILDVGERWNYHCGPVTPTATVVNTVTASGQPLNPMAAGAPFPAPNPEVSADDHAVVEVTRPAVDLIKTATPDVVLLDATPGGTRPVTYTFTARNTGDTPLGRPGAAAGGPGTKDPGWVEDSACPATTYGSGDEDGNDVLDPDETWTFSCVSEVGEPTVNVAAIVAQPSEPDGTPLPIGTVNDDAAAIVDVVRAAVSVTITRLASVVLDPDAPLVAGPVSGPATYLYDVANTGDVALSIDDVPPSDDICPDVRPVTTEGSNAGDVDGDGVVGPNEVWQYRCDTYLDRARDSNTPPVVGAESGIVTNTVTVTGVPVLGSARRSDVVVTAHDATEVVVIEPRIKVTKTASPDVARVNDDVTYTVVVANIGDVTLGRDVPAEVGCFPFDFVGGDVDGDGLLDGANSGSPEQWTYRCTRRLGLPAPPATTIDNTVRVTGVDPTGNIYGAEATASVLVYDPGVHVTVTPSATLVPRGQEVTFDFSVTNAGSSPRPADDSLAAVELFDRSSARSRSCDPAFTGGDVNGNGLLDRQPPEVWSYRCTTAVVGATTVVAVVRATAGTGFSPPRPVSEFDIASASAQPFTPALAVTKTASAGLLEGSGAVTYSYAVHNTGDVPLANLSTRIADDRCPALRFVGGDDDGDGLLDTPTSLFEDADDETWRYTCATTLDVTTTNTVTATGTAVDAAGAVRCACDVTAQASATVAVNRPRGPAADPAPNPAAGPADTKSHPTEGTLAAGGAARAVPMVVTGFALVTGGGALLARRRRHPGRVTPTPER